MAYMTLVIAFGALVAGSPLSVAQVQSAHEEGAPPAPADARYCLRVDPLPDSRVGTIRCETREGWARLDVDVDKEWPTQGVRVLSSARPESA